MSNFEEAQKISDSAIEDVIDYSMADFPVPDWAFFSSGISEMAGLSSLAGMQSAHLERIGEETLDGIVAAENIRTIEESLANMKMLVFSTLEAQGYNEKHRTELEALVDKAMAATRTAGNLEYGVNPALR